jgi:hypothetical protein
MENPVDYTVKFSFIEEFVSVNPGAYPQLEFFGDALIRVSKKEIVGIKILNCQQNAPHHKPSKGEFAPIYDFDGTEQVELLNPYQRMCANFMRLCREAAETAFNQQILPQL